MSSTPSEDLAESSPSRCRPLVTIITSDLNATKSTTGDSTSSFPGLRVETPASCSILHVPAVTPPASPQRFSTTQSPGVTSSYNFPSFANRSPGHSTSSTTGIPHFAKSPGRSPGRNTSRTPMIHSASYDPITPLFLPSSLSALTGADPGTPSIQKSSHRNSSQKKEQSENTSSVTIDQQDNDGDREEQDDAASDSSSVSEEEAKSRRFVLACLVILKVFTAFDSGAFSIILGERDGLAEDLGLSPAEQGALGSSVFLGNLVGCLVAGGLFSNSQKYEAKTVFLSGMIAHACFAFCFGFTTSFEYALVIRFLVGVTVAFPVVFSPIWVERFGPSDRYTTWMAFVNVGVPIGIMLGFVTGGLLPSYTTFSWRAVFYGKSLVMAPVLYYLQTSVPASLLETNSSTSTEASSAGDDNDDVAEKNNAESGPKSTSSNNNSVPMYSQKYQTLLANIKLFASHPLYYCNVMTLCALYFVVTALQLFVTPYLRAAPFNASMSTIVIGFGGTVVTAPVFGVLAGGVLIDRLGGYHKETALAMKVQALWGCIAFGFALVTINCTTVYSFLLGMWGVLAAGGAIVPVATGVLIASIPEEHRAAASSFGALCFNLFGYFSGPLFCGMVASYSGSLTTGIHVCLILSVMGVIPSSFAAHYAMKTNATLHAHQHHHQDQQHDTRTEWPNEGEGSSRQDKEEGGNTLEQSNQTTPSPSPGSDDDVLTQAPRSDDDVLEAMEEEQTAEFKEEV